MKASTLILIFSLHALLHLHQSQCKTLNTITHTLPLLDGDVLLSEDGNYALGFFSPGHSTRRFIGIWYNRVNVQTVFWVGNREMPINDTSGVLSIDSRGNLVLHCNSKGISPLWSTNISTTSLENATAAQLQDTGNFILLQMLSKRVLWQSFDHPTDSWMPFMKLGLDWKRGMDRFLTSWQTEDDPRPGNFTYRIDRRGYSQIFVYKNGAPYWRTGMWNGLYEGRVVEIFDNNIFNGSFLNDQNELSFMYGIKNRSFFSRIVIGPSGLLQLLIWRDRDGRWEQLFSFPEDQCDYYRACGPNSNCNSDQIGQFECTCLPGFEPRSQEDWFRRDGSGGCVRIPGVSTCRRGEGFVKVAGVKIPDTSNAHVDMSLSLEDCEQECFNNCSCTAYASANSSSWGGIGCLAWYDDDLLDTRTVSNYGQDLHIRVDAVTLAHFTRREGPHVGRIIIAITIIGSTILVIMLSFTLFMLKKRKGRRRPSAIPDVGYFNDELCSLQDLKDDSRKLELPFFDLSTIAAATNDFSAINKLGRGGFGSVYKGALENGKEIAVKRLSKSSGQGIEEFKNEVKLIAKLQHRNLVKILGCCVQEEEKMLIYEYMPNKSLDSFLFDEQKSAMLDWRKRFEIAYGIARGILYLHEDSRLRIIHRDLKASNVLLDASMNPKISDFGMARICGEDQIEGNTRRVVGTFGYMSPEYVMDGRFSVRSDVYSFGVLLLEIISGKRNSSFYQENSSSNLVGHVWELWKEGSCLDIVDPSLGRTYPEEEVLRCIQIGLLCVQDVAKDRPTMSAVVFMLGNKLTVPSPNQQASAFSRIRGRADTTPSGETPNSVNEVSLTTIEAR